MMSTVRERRRELIVNLVERHRIANQEQLQKLLRNEGVEVTQATISRDLRDLGITKGPAGYVRITLDQIAGEDANRLRHELRTNAKSVETAGTLLVIRTAPDRASTLAALLEQARIPHCLGAIAGDDTVFIATRSAGQTSELARMIENLMRQESPGA